MNRPTSTVADPISLASCRPVVRPVMTQEWRNLTYVHWRYDPPTVQRLLPPGFHVDTFDGDAFVGLIPFEMRNIAFPLSERHSVRTGRFGTFPETNVRTYITDRYGRRGVWFFSLDITRIAPTLIARVAYGLPYCFADMSISSSFPDEANIEPGSVVRYESRRRWPTGETTAPFSSIAATIGQQLAVAADSVDAFTSARWALGSRLARRRLWAAVDHPTWDLHHAELSECDETLTRAAGLPAPTGEPIVRWSPGVSVRISRPSLA